MRITQYTAPALNNYTMKLETNHRLHRMDAVWDKVHLAMYLDSASQVALESRDLDKFTRLLYLLKEVNSFDIQEVMKEVA